MNNCVFILQGFLLLTTDAILWLMKKSIHLHRYRREPRFNFLPENLINIKIRKMLILYMRSSVMLCIYVFCDPSLNNLRLLSY